MIQKLHGVNLGGWLLLEKWMTPNLFDGSGAIDEYTFMQTPDADRKIKQHRDTFITESDFAWLQSHGINAVRIPVGYWILINSAPYISAIEHLDWAMDMAKKYNLQVVIDLHGLKGSQNGRDHSGQVGSSEWFSHKEYQQQTIKTLVLIARRYRSRTNLWGIQVINEPKLGLFHFTLRRFYRQAYARLTKAMRPGTYFVYSDAYSPRLLSGAVRAKPGFPVAMDVHVYHMTTLFSKFISFDWFMRKTIRRKQLLERLGRRQQIIIGEWSGVLRHELAQTIAADTVDDVFKEYVKLQLDTFSHTAGWFYWNYKTQEPGQWNFRSEVENGLIEPPNL